MNSKIVNSRELVVKLSEKGQVVMLIDEYDKPIIDYLDNIPQAVENQDYILGYPNHEVRQSWFGHLLAMLNEARLQSKIGNNAPLSWEEARFKDSRGSC